MVPKTPPVAYDAKRDYFPDKLAFRHSVQAQVEYHPNYKVLTIAPRPNPDERTTYWLVQRGTPPPKGADPRRTIEVPVGRFVLAHDECAGAVEVLGLEDKLLATSGADRITTPAVRRLIDGGLKHVNGGSHTDVETALSLHPEVVMTYWSAFPDYGNGHTKLEEVGLKTAMLIPHWEATPLGFSEWTKVIALFFNEEKRANVWFDGVESRYKEIKAKVAQDPHQPVFLSQGTYGGRWSVSNNDIYTIRALLDAGGRYFHDHARRSGVEAKFDDEPFEAVFKEADRADVWVDAPDDTRTLDELKAKDSRYAMLGPFRRRRVYNQDGGLDPKTKRNAYHDGIMLHPDDLLADYASVFHPALFPNRKLVYVRRLD